MSSVYLETSALLQWLFGQPLMGEARKRVNQATHVTTSVLTLIETERAIIRAERLGGLSARDAKKLRTLVNSVSSGWVRLALTEAVQRRAMRAFPVEPIRMLDALHLASAISLLAAYPDLYVLSFDARINDNAKALGLL